MQLARGYGWYPRRISCRARPSESSTAICRPDRHCSEAAPDGLASATGSGTGPVMKRTLQSAFAAAALLASSSAWAQDFGEKGQIAISAERLFGFTYDSFRASPNNQDATGSVTHFSLLSSPVTI